ncbi:MAG: hypothetical protein NTV23_07770 [Propionibacteriales bacterium]|nr:hypothetical protein [Propionibacteriales bacterium]
MVDDARSAERPVRVVVMTTDKDGNPLTDAVAAEVPFGEHLEIGREGDLLIADDPEDPSISRVAVRLRTTARGAMELSVNNLNGAAVHPWGARTRYLPPGTENQVIAGRVGIRVIGATTLDVPGARVYWVIVEGDAADGPRIPVQRSGVTVANALPVPLTDLQRETVQMVFAEHLAWPPLPTPMALTIDAAARRLGISATGVTERLVGVRKKAHGLGMAQQFGVADPEYVHVLAAHGYLEAPTAPLLADDLALF